MLRLSFFFNLPHLAIPALRLWLLGRCDPRLSCISTSLHRVRLWQGGPASTYFRFRLLVFQFTGTSILGVRPLGHPELRMRPWPLRSRGDGNAVASSARLAFLRAPVCACCTLRQTLSLFGLCTVMVH